MKFDFQTDQVGANLASKHVLLLAAEPIFKRRVFQKRTKVYRPRYFDIDCVRTSKELRKLGSQDRTLRQKFFKIRKDLKRTIKMKINIYKATLVARLNDTSLADPQKYWKIVEELNSLYSERVDDTSQVLVLIVSLAVVLTTWVMMLETNLRSLLNGQMPDASSQVQMKSFKRSQVR